MSLEYFPLYKLFNISTRKHGSKKEYQILYKSCVVNKFDSKVNLLNFFLILLIIFPSSILAFNLKNVAPTSSNLLIECKEASAPLISGK